jgi:hypothetical protein
MVDSVEIAVGELITCLVQLHSSLLQAILPNHWA